MKLDNLIDSQGNGGGCAYAFLSLFGWVLIACVLIWGVRLVLE